MPYLRDHCFYRQPDDWPDDTDRRPVVPATTVLHHLIDAAEATHGRLVTAITDARFRSWVVAAPAVDIPITVDGPRIAFGGHAEAGVELDTAYPAPPAPWPPDATERPPTIDADRLYADRWMFHGPLFQGVAELTAISDTGVRGVLRTPPAPGALLDNVGQLLGYWIMATRPDRTVVFPVGMRRIAFHGPHPAPGTRLACAIRIRQLSDAELVADAQLIADGRVWAAIDGWVDRRFDSRPETVAVERFVERNTLSVGRPGGWWAAFDRWPDLASRDLMARKYLNAAERADSDARTPRARRLWLLGRIAVKDAVRDRLWAAGAGDIFPSELRVGNEPTGRPFVIGAHGRLLPPIAVSLAHRGDVGVALVGAAPGIDVEEVTERPASTEAAALGPTEVALLTALGGERALWFTRFWAAKEAVAKADGTGLRARPRRFAVVAADETRLTVRVDARDHHVTHTVLFNPPDLTPRRYVVAWLDKEAPR
jgi:phosphopantetheinyl transferase